MAIDKEDSGKRGFQRSDHLKLSAYGKNMKSVNTIAAFDDKRSTLPLATNKLIDLEQLEAKVKGLHGEGAIELVTVDYRSKGRAKKVLDAIFQKRSRGISAIIKTIKIKLALKRMKITPNKLTKNTPDDPVLLGKLIALAQSFGIDVQIQPKQSRGRTRLIIDSIITQRSGGDPMVAKTTRIKLMLKGINPDVHTLDTLDDPKIIQRLTDIAKKMDVKIPMATTSNSDRIKLIL